TSDSFELGESRGGGSGGGTLERDRFCELRGLLTTRVSVRPPIVAATTSRLDVLLGFSSWKKLSILAAASAAVAIRLYFSDPESFLVRKASTRPAKIPALMA